MPLKFCPFRLPNTEPPLYNVVTGYGAVGDGAHDDQPAVQAAVAACSAAGGGVVYMPAGTYRFDTGISLPTFGVNINVLSGVTIRGAGQANTITVGNAAGQSNFGGYLQSNPRVEYLSCIESGYDVGEDGLKFVRCTGVNVNYVSASMGNIGMGLYGCTGVTVRNTYTNLCGGGGIVVGSHGADYVGTGTLIEDCVNYSSQTGFRLSGIEDVNHLAAATLNRCSSTGDAAKRGFQLCGCDNLTVNDCTSDANGGSSAGFLLAGVATGLLHTCTPAAAIVYTVEDNGYFFNAWGACTNITVN